MRNFARCAGCFVALTLAAMPAIGADTVRIGGEDKPAFGRLVSATAGDVACYLEFSDAQGESFSEMATFEVCENAEPQVGLWLSLAYEVGQVMADSCEGNPDCTESESKALVSGLTAAGETHSEDENQGADAGDEESFIPTLAQSGPHLCDDDDLVAFNCAIDQRVLSVCAVGSVNLPEALIYRYGKPGAKIEMELPRAGASGSVYGRSEMYAGGGGIWLRFRNVDHAYVVYSAIGRFGDEGQTEERAGVAIERRGQLLNNLRCTGPNFQALTGHALEDLGMDPDAAEIFELP